MSPRRRLATSLATILALIGVGTVGFTLLEGWPPFNALYFTVTTISTVGYGELWPLSTAGRTFAMLLILVGVGGVFYSLTSLAEVLIEEQVAPAAVRQRRMRRRVRRMQDHVIVCGFGRVGAQVAAELAREGVTVAIIDLDSAALERAAAAGHCCIAGDASAEAVLVEAGIDRARGLVTTTNSDANNVYVTLAARTRRADLFIVARMDRDEAAARLRTAGADRVISPYHLGGRRMAALVVRPAVVDFVDTVLGSAHDRLQLEEVQVRAGAPLDGQALALLAERVQGEAAVLAIMKRDGGVLSSPPAATRVAGGDVLIVLGEGAALRTLEGLAAGAPRAEGRR